MQNKTNYPDSSNKISSPRKSIQSEMSTKSDKKKKLKIIPSDNRSTYGPPSVTFKQGQNKRYPFSGFRKKKTQLAKNIPFSVKSIRNAIVEANEKFAAIDLKKTKYSNSKPDKRISDTSNQSLSMNLNKVDPYCPIANKSSVQGVHKCSLVYCDVETKVNKFYIIQVLHCQNNTTTPVPPGTTDDHTYYIWSRGGKLGQIGSMLLKGPMIENRAINEFTRRFSRKTGIRWKTHINQLGKINKSDDNRVTTRAISFYKQRNSDDSETSIDGQKPAEPIIKTFIFKSYHSEKLNRTESLDMSRKYTNVELNLSEKPIIGQPHLLTNAVEKTMTWIRNVGKPESNISGPTPCTDCLIKLAIGQTSTTVCQQCNVTGKDTISKKLCLDMISAANLQSAVEPCSKCLLMFANDNNMYQKLRKEIELSVQRMYPIGKPSRIQIEKGFEYLIGVEEALRKGAPKSELQRVSSLFYTVIPHEFTKEVIPISDMPSLVKEVSLLLTAYFQAPF